MIKSIFVIKQLMNKISDVDCLIVSNIESVEPPEKSNGLNELHEVCLRYNKQE